MQHKVKVTVLDKKLYPELQQEYCACLLYTSDRSVPYFFSLVPEKKLFRIFPVKILGTYTFHSQIQELRWIWTMEISTLFLLNFQRLYKNIGLPEHH